MRSLRGRFSRMSARRVWNLDGTPGWEFRFTTVPKSIPKNVPKSIPKDVPKSAPQAVDQPAPGRERVRFVTSRGVEIGGSTLRIDQFHHRIRKPAGPAGPAAPAGSLPESADVEPALVELAADPEDESVQHRLLARLELAHDWFKSVPVLEVSAAWISGEGLGRSLDGVFVWRAEGTRTITYVVSPNPGTRALLAADPDLTQALVRAACPHPDDALGELESSLREAIVRLGVANPAQVRVVGAAPAAELVLRVDPVGQEKSETERALSEELAELARKVGTASVRKPPASRTGRALEAG
jgi:hypothetical protein